ncbi:hypothetical protein V2J56_09130 [Georgenia sp. MJ206]|uniref:hypothetical protein n=1 Tax=Georgenia wangjunii TaxID=3117730 RepID=UPI002F26DEC3
MTSGGARGQSGPPPDPNALRRDRKSDQSTWTNLPRRCGDEAPAWPLDGQTARERDLWAELWSAPQAKMWHQLLLNLEVALYTRYVAEAEKPDASAGLRTLVRQHQDSLGISTSGMNRLRWRVVPDEMKDRREERAAAAEATAQPPRRNARGSVRERLGAISGGA